MAEVGLILMVRINEVQLCHKLAAVAYTERECVLTGIELVESLLSLRVVEEGACPSLCRAKHVAVGESSAEHYHVDVLQSLASADEVGHHHVLHVETCEIQRVCHLTVAIGTLFTYDGSTYSRHALTVRRDAELCERAVEVRAHDHLHWLLLIVGEAFLCHAVHALLLVELV